MKMTKRLLAVLLVLVMAFTMVMPVTAAEEEVPDALDHFAGRVVGYFPYYRMEYLDSIDFSGVTHVILSFLTYKSGTFGFEFTDEDIQRVKEKCDANGVKLLIALGGGGGFSIGDNPFATEAGTKAFVDEIMSYVDKYDLDGVDIDTEIESGTFWGTFDSFMAELSGRLKPDGKLLTMAVSPWFTGSIQNSTFDYFDFINVMAYDESAGAGPVASMEFMYEQVEHYMGKNISVDRLVIGVPFYGYVKNGGWGGGKTYAEILADNPENRYADYSESFGGVYYNGEDTIRQKAEISKNYGGIMIWELGQDSFDERSLLAVVKDVMTEGGTISDMKPVSNLHTTSLTPSTVSFTWTASPDAVKYEVYQGSELLGTTTSTNYSAMNLTAMENYIFKVAAVSATGEVSKKVPLGITMPIGAESDFTQWSMGTDFPKDSRVVYEGKVYYAKWYSVNEQPGGAHYYAWEYLGDVAPDEEPSIIVSTDKIGLEVGETTTIAASVASATWSTSDVSVATIENGVITGVKAGKATITAKNSKGDTATCEVTVSGDSDEPVEPPVEEETTQYIVFKVGQLKAYSSYLGYGFDTDAETLVVDNKAFVPMRFSSFLLEAECDYNAATKQITLNFSDYTVACGVDSTTATLSNSFGSSDMELPSDQTPRVINGKTYLPARVLSQFAGITGKYQISYLDNTASGNLGHFVTYINGTTTDSELLTVIQAANSAILG